MPPVITDAQLTDYEAESKPLPTDYERRLFTFSSSSGHARSQLDVDGDRGNRYSISLRQGLFNPLDFSAIFSVYLAGGVEFRLRRYNGKAHTHSNKIERGPRFYDFHIHRTTERYQLAGGCRPDGFAEVTNRYSDLWSAVACLLDDCNFVRPLDTQLTLVFPDLL